MLDRLTGWWERIHVPRAARARLGFGTEYWDSDPTHYEAAKQLRDRLAALGRKTTKRGLAYDLASHLLDDVAFAAGGVERAILRLRDARCDLKEYVTCNGIQAEYGIPNGLCHDAAVDAFFAFADVLSWSRTLTERLDRAAVDRKKFPRQGLVPALKPVRLRKRCEGLLAGLLAGPVGQARHLTNFTLHSALVRNPFTGVQIEPSGEIVLPIPDSPGGQVGHWYLLTWSDERDGFAFAEEMWECIQAFMDQLLEAFERAVPRRLRKETPVV